MSESFGSAHFRLAAERRWLNGAQKRGSSAQTTPALRLVEKPEEPKTEKTPPLRKRLSDLKMAPQTLGIAQNGLGNGGARDSIEEAL